MILYPALALALLGAMGALGIGLLARTAPWLDRLERWVYGATLGVVIGSLALLLLAWPLGLTVRTVWLVAVGCAAGAVFLLRGGMGRTEPEASSPGRFAVVVLLVLVVRLGLFWSGAVRVESDGMWVAYTGLWGDWAQHLGDVTAFVYGDNFPPGQTRFAGSPLAYHYLTSVTAAAMVVAGLTPWSALALQSFVFSVIVVLSLFVLARRFTGDTSAAALVALLFLVGGGLGWTLTLEAALGPGGSANVLLERPWDTGRLDAENYQWLNVFFSSIAPQRAYLYGIPLYGLILTSLSHAVRTRALRWFALAGAVAGLLPFAHLGAMLCLALVTPIVAVQVPMRGWVGFFAVWTAVGLPQVVVQQGGTAGVLASFRWAPGWVSAPDLWIWFWLKNLGLFLPLLVWALGETSLIDRISRRMLWAFMPLFVAANLFVFQPWDWDNTKLLVFWYLAACVFVAALLVRVWRRFPAVAARGTWVLIVASLLLSGVLQNFHQLLGLDRNRLLTRDELTLADRVREATDPHARFLTGQQHNHPIHVMAGRAVVLGYPGWLWSQGYDYRARQQDVRSMYALDGDAVRLLEHYAVDYVVVGPWEREKLAGDPEAFRSRYPSVIRTESYEVFAVGRTGDRATSTKERSGGR
ncbi:MAG TPA: hypothetical protein VD788_16195 [Candidatus Polarisedimenticolaceae bacterium]|nr:hypothetical protein [Candidatus Polarisedimenticolaceae bacterium]